LPVVKVLGPKGLVEKFAWWVVKAKARQQLTLVGLLRSMVVLQMGEPEAQSLSQAV
jgi:hypothetical protein